VKCGETLNFSLDKQMERVVEVLALSALVANNHMRNESLKKLREIAFPLTIELEKEIKGICSVVHCMNTHKNSELVADINGKTPICVTCLEGGK